MRRRYVVAIALLVGVLVGGFLALAPTTTALGTLNKDVGASDPERGGGGTVTLTPVDDGGIRSTSGALTCSIDCIEEPDITVSGDITIDDCISICEDYCGGPCAPA